MQPEKQVRHACRPMRSIRDKERVTDRREESKWHESEVSSQSFPKAKAWAECRAMRG